MATKLDLADAQFLGYSIGKQNTGIMELVISMGLTKQEWLKWKLTYPICINIDEINEIDIYFKLK